MCGIALIFEKSNRTLSRDFGKSVALMKHRGPDNFGYYAAGKLHFYHYRLSILDIDPRSNQPFHLSNGNILLYNGEIYNFKDLRAKYEISCITSSDTEVLAKLLDDRGADIIPELNGIFSFVFYNVKEEKLLIARDRLGVKPLYVFENEEILAFASEAKVLYDYLPSLSINVQAMHEFFYFGSTISDESIIKDVKRFPHAHFMVYDLKSYNEKTSSYWSIKHDIISNKLEDITYEEALKKTRALLIAAIERQCISDVPVGAYLSGGIDSSVVVSIASEYTNQKLKTFSVHFEGSDISELKLARLIAEKYKTEHHEFEVTTKGIEHELEDLIFQYDEPFADAAFIPLHLMGAKCREEVTVVLQGDGGDEVFAGYGRHLDASQLLKRKIASAVLSKISPNAARRKSMEQRANLLWSRPAWKRMANMVSQSVFEPIKPIIGPAYQKAFENTNPFKKYETVYQDLKEESSLNQMLFTDMQVILPYTYMDKVDRISMYHSLEARVPLLDNDLAEFVMRLPDSYKIRNGITKSFLREIASEWLPADILKARKQSFGTPIYKWISTILYEFVHTTLHEAKHNYPLLFDFNYIFALLDDIKKGRRTSGAITIWRLTVFVMWLNRYKSKITIH